MLDSQNSKEIDVKITRADEEYYAIRFEGFGAPAHAVAIEWRGADASGERIVTVASQSLRPSGICEIKIAVDDLLWAASPSRRRGRNAAPFVVVLDRAGRELAHSAQPVDLSQPHPAHAWFQFGGRRAKARAETAEAEDRGAGIPFAPGEAESIARKAAGALLLAALFLGVFALARPVVLATLGAAEETITVTAGSTKFACLGDKALLPSTFGVLEAVAVTKGQIDIKADKNPNGREKCLKNLLEVSVKANVPPGRYKTTYSVSDFVFAKSADLIIEVEEAESLDAVNLADFPCLRQGASVTINLAGSARLNAKAIAANVDSVFGPVTVGKPEPNHPFRLRITANRNASGMAEIKFHFSAGTKFGTAATVRILNVQPACPRAPPPPPGTAVVAMTHGFIVADFGPNFSRQPGGALPGVNVITEPQHAKTQIAGQFIVLTGLSAAPGLRDSIDYTVTPPGLPAEPRHLDIVYDDMCEPVLHDEELLYMPAGEYFEPPGPGLNSSTVHQRFFAILTTVPGVDVTRGLVIVGKPYCLQTRVQQVTPDIRQILNKAGVDPNRLKGMSFESIDDLAMHMSNSASTTYAIPAASQWIAGLILALSIGGSQAGDPAFNTALKDGYLSGVHEWINQPYGMITPPQYYLFGPSKTEPDKWISWQKRGFTSPYIGARLMREP